jgi:hypothetical protein
VEGETNGHTREAEADASGNGLGGVATKEEPIWIADNAQVHEQLSLREVLHLVSASEKSRISRD